MSKQERDGDENRGSLESNQGKEEEEGSKLYGNTTIVHCVSSPSRMLDVKIL